MRALGKKMMDQRNIETGRVSVDLKAPAADHAAGNNGLGHRGNPARLPWTMPARRKRSARMQRRQDAGAASAFVVSG
jgi:hypothetical protein